MKWSVIIPTMWRSDLILELVQRLSDEPLVGEIIVIDNAVEVSRMLELCPTKLVALPQKENIMVNPAWNLGVETAKRKRIALVNDDILFDPGVMFSLGVQVGQVIGLGTSCYEENLIGPPRLEISHDHNYGWGCAILTRRESWQPIPAGIKIWYGDNWLRLKAKISMAVEGLPVKTQMSATSISPEFGHMIEQDTENWKNLVDERPRRIPPARGRK
jgi:hypothetical protein